MPFTGANVADYRTPLPYIFAGLLEAAVNRVLAMDNESATRLARLEGKLLQLDLDGLGIRVFFSFDYGTLSVSLQAEEEPDTVISGSPVALFAMAASNEISDWGLSGSSVRIEGNANLARDLERVFGQLDPDWESPLAELLGDTLGFQLSQGLRQGAEAVQQAARTAAEMAAGYFRDESGVLVKPAEMNAFNAGVDQLRESVDRLEARIRELASEDS